MRTNSDGRRLRPTLLFQKRQGVLCSFRKLWPQHRQRMLWGPRVSTRKGEAIRKLSHTQRSSLRGLRLTVRWWEKTRGNVVYKQRHIAFRRLCMRVVLGAAAFEDPTCKSRLDFGLDPLLDQVA